MSIVVPDSITPVVGWKGWRLDDGFLASPTYALDWPIRERAVAACHVQSPPRTWGILLVSAVGRLVWCAVGPDGERVQLGSYDAQSSEPPPIVLPPDWRYEVGPFDERTEAARTGPAPHENCGCGIYATSILDCRPYAVGNKRKGRVFGRIHAWGKVIEGDHGFRAQYAYPKDIYLIGFGWRDRKRALRALAAYDVPVYVVSSTAEAYVIAEGS